MNKELHEAAALDGAGAWRRFWTVTVPAVKPAMLLISALITVSAMRIFSEIYVLTNGSGGPGGQAQSIVMLIQATGKGLRGNLGYASALSVALFFLTIGPLLLVAWINQGPEIRAALRLRKKSKAAQKAHELRLKEQSSLKEKDVHLEREELAEAGASNTEVKPPDVSFRGGDVEKRVLTSQRFPVLSVVICCYFSVSLSLLAPSFGNFQPPSKGLGMIFMRSLPA